MIFYCVAAIAPLISWLYYDSQRIGKQLNTDEQERFKRKVLFVAILPMVLLFVLRYKYVGADTIGYVRFFQGEVRGYSFKELLSENLMRIEVGYRLYVKLISLLTDNYTVYFLINAIVIFGSLYRFSLKYTNNPFIFFYLFITLGTYQFIETGLRQSLAMIICLWAVDFIKDRRPIRFLLVVALAYLFHKSAMIFLLIYPLCSIKRYRWMAITYVIIAIVFIFGFANFQSLFNELLGYDYEIEETGNGGIFLAITILVCAYSVFVMVGKGTDKENQTAIIQMAFMTVVFWLLRLVSRTAERISFYFIFGLYTYFSQTVDYDDSRLKTAFRWAILAVCIALFVYRILGVKYQFFWQGV